MLRAAGTLATVLALVGCTANSGDEGFVVLNNSAITMGTVCMFTGTVGQATQSHGQINVNSPSGYLLTPLIQSRVTALSGQELQRTIQLHGADVTLEVKSVTLQHNGTFSNPTVSLPSNLAQFSSLFSGSLGPSATANVSFDIMGPQAIQAIGMAAGAGSGDRLNAEVLATVSMYGDLGGDQIKALPFQYPISVCSDCVVVEHGACPISMGTVRPGNPCQPYQDGTVDCCRDTNNNLICPAPTM